MSFSEPKTSNIVQCQSMENGMKNDRHNSKQSEVLRGQSSYNVGHDILLVEQAVDQSLLRPTAASTKTLEITRVLNFEILNAAR